MWATYRWLDVHNRRPLFTLFTFQHHELWEQADWIFKSSCLECIMKKVRMIIIQNSEWLIRCWDLLTATSGIPSFLILKLHPYCVSYPPLMTLGVSWENERGLWFLPWFLTFLNDSNYRNILSGTARLREKWQLQQDCNRKNSHQGLKTQCLC